MCYLLGDLYFFDGYSLTQEGLFSLLSSVPVFRVFASPAVPQKFGMTHYCNHSILGARRLLWLKAARKNCGPAKLRGAAAYYTLKAVLED